MSYSYTQTETTTFTITHARHIAAKVATDLKRLQRFYGEPSDIRILHFEAEIIELLRYNYLDEVTYGFQREGNWIEPTLKYKARELAGASADDNDPGRVFPGADIRGASFYSFLIYSSVWDSLSPDDKNAVKERLPLKRTDAPEPGISGYLSDNCTYSAAGRALNRTTVRNY